MTKKTLEMGQDKIQKICDALRKETLEPAKEQAEAIINDAKLRAEQIIQAAEQRVEQMMLEARRSLEQERNVLHSSLSQAGKQSVEQLKQAIEHKLFNPELQRLITQSSSNPKVIADLITAIVKAIDKEGLGADISAIIPSKVSSQEVCQLLGKEILDKLKNGTVDIGDFGGGTKIVLNDKQITLDISDSELENILSRYVRKDFRQLLFAK